MVKIKRLKKIIISDVEFKMVWDKDTYGGSFNYNADGVPTIKIGTKIPALIFGILVHELMEVCLAELNCRYSRADVTDDYLFSCHHDKHATACAQLAGLLSQFVEHE